MSTTPTACQHEDVVRREGDGTPGLCLDCRARFTVAPVAVPRGRTSRLTVSVLPMGDDTVATSCKGPGTPDDRAWSEFFPGDAATEDATAAARQHLRTVHGQG